MRYKKTLSSDSASGLLQTLVGKPVLRPNRLAKEFDETMRKAFKDSLAKAGEADTTEEKFQFLSQGLMDLAKAVSAPKNVDFESKHVRAQGGRFGAKPKANETSDGPDLTDPKQAKKAWEDRVALGESREDFQALKQELYELGSKWSTDDVVSSKEWFDSSLAKVEDRLNNSLARAQVSEYKAHLAKFDSSPDKLATYVDLLTTANKYDIDNSNVTDLSLIQPTRIMYRKLSEQMVAKGVAEDPAFPRFTLELGTPPHVTLEKVTSYNNAVKQLHFKGLDLEAQEFIVKSTDQTMQEFDAYDPYRDLTDKEVEKAWDTSIKLLNYYRNNGSSTTDDMITDPSFKQGLRGDDWSRVLRAVVRSTTYTVGDWFGVQAEWAVQGMDVYVKEQRIPDVIMRLSLGKEEGWQKKTLFFGKALEHHREVYGEDEAFNRAKSLYLGADQAVSKLMSDPDAYQDPANQKPFVDFFTAMSPIVRSFVADTVIDSLTSQGPDERRSTFQTAFEGMWQEATLANIAKNSGNNLEGAETVIRTAEPHEEHAIMDQIEKSWDTKEHDSFRIEPHGVFVVERFAKHEVGFKQWADTKDHVGEYYHGTSHAASPLILTAGFRVPKNQNQVKTGSMFGNGIYLAPNASKSAQYGDESFSRGEGSGVLIGAKASLGITRDVVQSGDYAPQPHPIGPETNVFGEALNEKEYAEIKDVADASILLVNLPDSIYIAYGDQFQAGKPKVNYYKKQNGSLSLLGTYDLPLLPPIDLMGKQMKRSLSDSANEFIRSQFNVEYDADNDVSWRAVAEGKGGKPAPFGPKAFIFGDRLTQAQIEDLAPGVRDQVKVVLNGVGDKGLVYMVGKTPDGRFWTASYKATNKGRLVFDNMGQAKVAPEVIELMNKGGNLFRMGAMQMLGEAYPELATLGSLYNAFDLDQIGLTEAGYDSVRGLSSANGGNLKNDEIVVFDDAQVVPDYVISYTRRRKDDD